mmetsp:Transcript_2364/g.5926  ORF Transcript_2364/g.5926 Transcript_2364/m.5926 type:complete len:288 (-) Transcript_2364:409-1272(-)|eukprot:CAMPEP_0202859830 /NCGR_PEP_ID=MMETSP1391-20130828/1787_1 /ASSEMBLY_ACC=CAM_ASM_000867 /TAXON_ID=1034604 /ORGANISM="Chlamydomonas leiostraca, Strain SAG 11-49" /LENGTH=287 /DNA_ID=CAMNT_0049538921 /DNA_START=148 /DNA_END=1011 /DNA_ORIENTATION=-
MARLICIAASHYVERARWALDLGGVKYYEDRCPPIVHVKLVKDAGVQKTTHVPVLVTEDGQVLNDSQLILEWVHKTCPAAVSLYPTDPEQLQEVKRLETLFNGKLGVLTRVMCYHWLFSAGWGPFIAAVCDQPDTPLSRRVFFKVFSVPFKAMMAAGMRINAANSAKCLERVRSMFKEVDGMLADGRPFLVKGTTQPTAADITFASMGALVMLPLVPNYGGASCVHTPKAEVLPQEASAVAEELSQTPAGQHIIRLYTQHRLPVAAGTGISSSHAGQAGSTVPFAKL